MWSENAYYIEVRCTILVVHLLTKAQYSLELALQARLLEDLSLDALLDRLTSVNEAARQLPRLGHTLLDASSLLDHEHLVFVVDHETANSDEMTCKRWQPIIHIFINPFAHQDIVLLVVRMMKVETMSRGTVHQMTIWRFEENLYGTSSSSFPMLEAGC